MWFTTKGDNRVWQLDLTSGTYELAYDDSLVTSGTAPLSADDADAFQEKFGIPVLTSYAATEFGGGVAGLSAGRYLKKSNHDFLLIDLEDHVGGNAIGGNNKVASFPWGAHYLPLPGTNDTELIQFLEESKIITGWKDGLPVYSEYDLCHDPKERLYINHFWQEGLVPQEGIPSADRSEIERFLALMHEYKLMMGEDERYAFTIPVAFCSRDPKFIELDKISAAEFLSQHEFHSPYLRWYVAYCCADDYGSTPQQTSAWAMIHYFSSRKGNAANAPSDAVLTWPEGNYHLIKLLRKDFERNILTDTLAYNIELADDHVEIGVFDAVKNTSKKFIVNKLILATPQFVNQRLLTKIPRAIDYSNFQYAPWMVANLVVNESLQEGRGERLCWDNVIYGSNALGYVNASHQHVGIPSQANAITFYKPLLSNDPASERKQAFTKSFESWKEEIIHDLKIPHPGIEENIQELNVWIWGHGMIKPSPGFIWSENRMNAHKSIENKIYFAHSDLGGLSIFEEAFYFGHRAAKAVVEGKLS